jgi:negative regulator of sigma E activity
MSTDNKHSNSSNDPVSEHLRENVSALCDGELSASESAFMLKRMSHDAQLQAQWQRFQSIGETLRGNADALDADALSARILSKIAAEKAAMPVHSNAQKPMQKPWLKTLIGFGLAASVAWGALLFADPGNEVAPAHEFADATPVTVASPVVGIHTVSGRIGSSYSMPVDQNSQLLMQSMDTFLLEHAQGSPASPLSPAVYLQVNAAQ